MPEIEDLLAKARTLGEALAAHPSVQAYYATQRAMRADQAAQGLLQAYQTHTTRMHELEAGRQPVEVADKQKLRELEAQMAGNAALKALMRAQADYIDVMNRVNQAMDAPLTNLFQPEKPA